MISVTLSKPTNIVTVPAQSQTMTTLVIRQMIDNPDAQTVSVAIKGISTPIVLWSATTNPTYAQIGDWTNAQVEARLQSIYAS